LESLPLVSFVTPFYNTVEFLAECIDSVLRQTYHNWEYILVNNCSTDGSKEIAEDYAARFPGKIRLIHTKSFLSQVENYNFALSCISPTSKYCKMVQADDWLFPDCARTMLEVAEAHPRVGIVAAYQLEGERVALDGLPYPSEEVPGREVCRLYFLKRMYLFGTATSLLLRSELIRARNPFYEEQYAPFEDADICFRLLRTWNFGFVHQVLTYSRLDNQSILAQSRARGLLNLYRFSVVVEHGRDFLSEQEYKRSLKDAERCYFLYLARCALRGRSHAFWDLHRKGLASVNYPLNRWSLGKWIPRAMLEKSWESFWRRWDRDSLIAADPEALSD
jgi:glycosyltransferase involved in cell wall biosynthesis